MTDAQANTPHTQNSADASASSDTHKRKLGAVRVLTLTVVFLLISIGLCIGVQVETINVTTRYETIESINSFCTLCEEAVVQAGKTSGYLTAESCLFAITEDVTHALNYFEESEQNKRREHSLQTIQENYDDPEVVHLLEDAMKKSNELMYTEEYSMVLLLTAQGLVPGDVIEQLDGIELSEKDAALPTDKKKELAAEILFNQQYAHDKGAIDEEVADALERITLRADELREGESHKLEQSLWLQQMFITLLVICTIASSLTAIVFVVLPLRDSTARLEKDERLEVKGPYELRYMAQTYNDIYDFKLSNENLLRDKAKHDPLTGILNRGAFDENLESL